MTLWRGLLAAGALTCTAAQAQQTAPADPAWMPRLDTTLSARTDVWSGSRQLDDAAAIARASLWGRAKLGLGDAGTLVGDAWLAAQTGAHPAAADGRVRELYWHGSQGRWDWKVGRQIIVWGRADGLNPTDNLTPRDYTLLVPEDNDQRRGNDWARLGLDLGRAVLGASWAPRAASHTLPLEALPQTTYNVAAPPRRSQWALKLDMTGDGADGSVSYFDGDDPLPDLRLQGLGATGALLGLQNNPTHVLGADLSLTHAGVIWRAEAAWMQTDNAGTDDFTRKRSRLWLVAGVEWSLPHSTTLGLQLSLQHVMGFNSPDNAGAPVQQQVAWRQAALANQTAANQAGLVWRLASRWWNDNLTAETSGVVTGAPRSALWRTKLSWALDDHLGLQAGSDVFTGPQASLWGQLRKNRVAYVQLRCGW